MSDTKLGTYPSKDAKRDAIHIAIAPVIAATNLRPGQHVGLIKDNIAGEVAEPIGIVDPFLQSQVYKGEMFYLLLYQQTITGMRHHWKHPAFPQDDNYEELYTVNEAYKKIVAWCQRYDQIPDQLIEAWKTESGFYVGAQESAKYDTEEITKALLDYTGIAKEGFYVSCAC